MHTGCAHALRASRIPTSAATNAAARCSEALGAATRQHPQQRGEAKELHRPKGGSCITPPSTEAARHRHTEAPRGIQLRTHGRRVLGVAPGMDRRRCADIALTLSGSAAHCTRAMCGVSNPTTQPNAKGGCACLPPRMTRPQHICVLPYPPLQDASHNKYQPTPPGAVEGALAEPHGCCRMLTQRGNRPSACTQVVCFSTSHWHRPPSIAVQHPNPPPRRHAARPPIAVTLAQQGGRP
jgi:hypothetical protein